MLKKWKGICLLLALSIGLFSFEYVQSDHDVDIVGIQITYLDVGQGDCEIITCDNETMIIDGGTRDSSDKIYTYLKNNHISTVKYVVASHQHEDHAGGLPAVFEAAHVQMVLLPQVTSNERYAYDKLLNKIDEKQVETHVVHAGETYSLGSASFTILGPMQYDEENANNDSIVLKMEYWNNTFLFTGDAEKKEEQDLLDTYGNLLKCDVVKVNHHGSADALLSSWYAVVQPQYAVISCGQGNMYGHPHQQVLDTLQQESIPVYRTDLQGDIVCVSDGDNIQISALKETQKDVFQAPEISGYKELTVDEDAEREYILNVHSMKIHLPECSSVKDISAKNRKEVFESLKNLEKQGFFPCKSCLYQ